MRELNEKKRSIGQRNLYFKLLRRVAESEYPELDGPSHREVAGKLHDEFKKKYGGGKSTSEMSVAEMWLFYTQVQAVCCEVFGVSGLDEDDGEFDHGFKKE